MIVQVSGKVFLDVAQGNIAALFPGHGPVKRAVMLRVLEH
jgi:hypothetical protein